MTPGAALFDLDGTLLDTPTLILECLEVVCSKRHNPLDRKHARTLIGKPLDVIFPLLLPQCDQRGLDDAKKIFRSEFSRLSIPRAATIVFPGMREILDRLKEQGQSLGVVTSKITSSAQELLEASDLADYFSVVIGHDMAPIGKPAPDLALLAALELAVVPQDTVVVGDSLDDIRMAIAAGMRSIGVGWGIGAGVDLLRTGASAIAPGVDSLREILSSMLLEEDEPV